MNDLRTIRVTFICSHCRASNELTAADLHETTMVHCSRCGASVAPLGLLDRRPAATAAPGVLAG